MSFQNGIVMCGTLKKHNLIYWWQVIQKIKTFSHYFQNPKISFRVLTSTYTLITIKILLLFIS